jgi:hypothetical protein
MSRPSPALHTQIFEPGTFVPAKSKMKLSHGVAAGAEDSKYQTKYRDLKKKVKELEADNDRLHFKVLEARKNVTRMKLERAVLYERLCSVPPTDEETRRGMQDPPISTPQGHFPASVTHPRLDQPDSRDPSVMEYIRNHSRPGGRPGASDTIPNSSAPSGHRAPPPQPFAHDQPDHLRSQSQSHPPTSVQQSTSRSSRPRGHDGPPIYHYPAPGESTHLDTFPHGQGGVLAPGEAGRERSRRHEIHEVDLHSSRVPPPHSPPHNDRDHERHLEVDREVDQERGQPPADRPPNRVPTPPFAQRTYPPPVYREGDGPTHRASADRELVGPGLHPSVSRSNTPASARGASGSIPSRPHSRLEREHQKSSHPTAPVSAPEGQDEEMQVEDDGPDARKRMREDYENGTATGDYLPDDRSVKKAHQEDASSMNGEGSKDVVMDADDA